eukprot:SAG31_NODE_1593_length_7811_cov_13.037215_3_plen_97_part_00
MGVVPKGCVVCQQVMTELLADGRSALRDPSSKQRDYFEGYRGSGYNHVKTTEREQRNEAMIVSSSTSNCFDGRAIGIAVKKTIMVVVDNIAMTTKS